MAKIVCPGCGKKISVKDMKCPKCGHAMQPDFKELLKQRKLNDAETIKTNKVVGGTQPYDKKAYEDLYNQGTILLKQGRINEALPFFHKALAMSDKDWELFNNIAVSHLQLGNDEEGLKWLNRTLDLNPSAPNTLLNKAVLLVKDAKYEEAIKALETLLKYNPNYSQAKVLLMQVKRQEHLFGGLKPSDKEIPGEALILFNNGMRSMHQNQLNEARDHMRAALKIYPKFIEANLVLGNIAMLLKNYQGAMEYFDNALKSNPELALAWSQKGTIHDQMKEYQKAIECYDKAIQIDPTYSASWNNKGLALDALKKYEEAIKCFDESIRLNPDFEGAWYNRATSYKKIGQIERALGDYQKSLELNPKNEDAKEQIDYLKHWSSAGQEGKIRTVIDSRDYCPRCGKKNYTNNPFCPHCGAKMHEENVEELLKDAIELENTGFFEEALLKFVRFNDVAPTRAEAWFYRGKAHCALAEFQNAMICFAKAQQLGFHAIDYLMMYGLMAKKNINKFEPPDLSDNNLDWIKIREDGFFQDEKSWTAQGASFQMLGQYEEAFKCYQNAIGKNSNYTPALQNKKFLLELSKK